MPEKDDELYLTPVPFYIHEIFRRLDKSLWYEFEPEEEDWEEDMKAGRVCPYNLWWYVMQRQKVMQNFDASHPPFCLECGKRMVADRTITRGDKDVAAFTCNCCHKLERHSRASVAEYPFYKKLGCYV